MLINCVTEIGSSRLYIQSDKTIIIFFMILIDGYSAICFHTSFVFICMNHLINTHWLKFIHFLGLMKRAPAAYETDESFRLRLCNSVAIILNIKFV